MKLGLALLIAHNIIEILVQKGILLSDGSFADNTINKDLQIASAIQQELINRGVVIDARVKKLIDALPGLITLVGIE